MLPRRCLDSPGVAEVSAAMINNLLHKSHTKKTEIQYCFALLRRQFQGSQSCTKVLPNGCQAGPKRNIPQILPNEFQSDIKTITEGTQK